MGPINEGSSRDEVVDRMLVLLEQAITEQVELIAYPEMALTTYFPKRIREDYDQFFEDEVPPKALEPLLRRAREKGVAVHVGFCEKANGHYFNTALLTDEAGTLVGTFRKIHLPGRPSPDGFAQVYEVRYFETGDTGYRVFSTRKAPRRHRDLPGPALPGVLSLPGAAGGGHRPHRVQHPALPAGARPERARPARRRLREQHVRGRRRQGRRGRRAGADRRLVHRGPLGQVLAKAATTGDELIAARIDLDWMTPARKRWDFFGRRQPQYYGQITEPVRKTS